MNAQRRDELEADVLVIGGGPAGAWAAWSAARHGARVVLAEKGYLGSSGATAPGGTNLLYLPPDPILREQAVVRRMSGGGQLAEPAWIHRVLDGVYESLQLVEEWGYPFVRDADNRPLRNHLQGPEYMRLMRKVVRRAGVRVLDQSPALALLADRNDAGGARGVNRLDGRDWEVRAPAVIVASGGCAFLSKGLGCNVLTGEGLLMAAELGAELSGMEFSNAYGTSADYATVTRNRLLNYATLRAADGTPLTDGTGRLPRELLARELLKGPVYAVLDRVRTDADKAMLRRSHAVFFLPYDRAGIDPFTQPFPLRMRFEGTVRGTGGIRLAGDNCETSVPGLYAAGDAAARERSHGAQTGGGAFNASWAICSGRWAGSAAARYARTAGPIRGRTLKPAKGSKLSARPIDTGRVIAAVQRETLPLEVSYFRSVPVLRDSLDRLESLWHAVQGGHVQGDPEPMPRERLRAREAAAMVTVARWMHTASLARTESRGMHRLAEHPETDPAQCHRLTIAGLDKVTVTPTAVPGWTGCQAANHLEGKEAV